MIHNGQEINGKLYNLVAEVHNLTERVEEAESDVAPVEGWAVEATRSSAPAWSSKEPCGAS